MPPTGETRIRDRCLFNRTGLSRIPYKMAPRGKATLPKRQKQHVYREPDHPFKFIETNLLLDPVVRQLVRKKNLDPIGLVESEPDAGLRNGVSAFLVAPLHAAPGQCYATGKEERHGHERNDTA
jgi:hypothetical protein